MPGEQIFREGSRGWKALPRRLERVGQCEQLGRGLGRVRGQIRIYGPEGLDQTVHRRIAAGVAAWLSARSEERSPFSRGAGRKPAEPPREITGNDQVTTAP